MKCVRSCDQQPLKQKKVFALKRSLIPRGFIYSSNMAHSLLFTPPTWWTWCHENILYWVTTSQIIKIKINCPPSPSFARFCESRISSNKRLCRWMAGFIQGVTLLGCAYQGRKEEEDWLASVAECVEKESKSLHGYLTDGQEWMLKAAWEEKVIVEMTEPLEDYKKGCTKRRYSRRDWKTWKTWKTFAWCVC